MEKMEPTIKELPASSEFSRVFEEKEVQDVSREDIAEMCNESFLLRGHTASILEKYLEKARSAEDFHFVVDAIEYLERRAENEPYHELEKDDLAPFLESIAQKDISYFVRENARLNLRVPLESSSVRYKRKLLQLEFENIRQEGVAIELFGQNDVRSLADIDALDDAIVIRAFHLYGEMNPAYYRWNEWMSLQQRLYEKSLDRLYDVSGDHEEALHDDVWSIQHERRRRERSILSRISDRFGVLYDASGSVESFFELDEKAEKREKLKEDFFGKISESHLEYFIDFFSSSERSNEEKMLRYIQVRPRLPKTLIEDFERRFPIFIPDQLQKDFRTQDDFEDESESFHESVLSSVSKEGQEKMMKDLVSRLSKLLYERQEIDRKENFGVASEDAENLLDFSLSNIVLDLEEVRPTAHGSICYYLFLRNKLPLELVNEFETRFDLKIPDRLKGFVSYDRYLKTNDRKLIAAINSGNASLEEMREWLLESIGTLKEKIQSKKVLTKKLSFQELLKREGLESNLLEDKNFEARYRFLLHPVFRKKIEDDFGIELKDFSVRVQVQFLNFLFEKNEEDVKKMIAFLKNGNAADRLKSFLSLEQSRADMGEKILAIGEKLPKEAADTVFAKYAEMADRASEARKNSEKDADAIEAKLLERGKSFLSWIAEHAEEFAHDEKLLSALSERLENLNAETILAVNALRVMKECENTEGIKEFLDGSFRILKGSDLSSKMKTEMESLYRMSYPSDREEKFREALVRNLYEQKIPDPSARFYTFFVGENGKKSLKAFCSFQDKVDEEAETRFAYFGAFNVDEFFSGEKMGCLMMDESLEREAKEHPVRAACIPEKPISEHYIEKRGFIGKSFSTLGGIDLLAIERDDKSAERYETKKMSQEDIIRESEAHFRDASRVFLSVPERSFSREGIEATLKEGFILTRLFRRGEGETAKVYLAFEK